jgi:hypothetical protein
MRGEIVSDIVYLRAAHRVPDLEKRAAEALEVLNGVDCVRAQNVGDKAVMNEVIDTVRAILRGE